MTLAVACFVVWVCAVAASLLVGPWPAVGGAAVLLAVLIFAVERAATRALFSVKRVHLLFGIVCGVIMSAVTIDAYTPLADVIPSIARDTASLYTAFRGMSLAMSLVVLVPVVVGEEMVWRGVIQSALLRRMGPVSALGSAAILYALAQAPMGSPILVLTALGCGIVWGAMRNYCGSLVPVIVAHVIWDVAVLLWHPLVPVP